MIARRLASLAPLSLVVLAACSTEAPEPEPTPAATADAGPRTLVGANLADIALGPKIAGPQGPEVTSGIIASDGTSLGEMVSYVACPAPETEDGETLSVAEDEECDPATQAEDAVYTYVHTIALDRPEPPAADSDAPPSQTMAFRMEKAAAGFNNVIGYDREAALAALGEEGDIGVQVEDGALIWRVVDGNGWQDGEELTFFWQSTSPPAGPEEAYELRIGDRTAGITGPFPAPAAASTGETGAN